MSKIKNNVGDVPDQGAYFRGKAAAEGGDSAPAKPGKDAGFTDRLFYRGYHSAVKRNKPSAM